MKPNGKRLSKIELLEMQRGLSQRDMQILEHVAALRLLSAGHLERLFFPVDQHATPATAARLCRRVLGRLTRDQLLVRLDRRVGGVRAGSASFIYGLGPVGQRLMANGSRRRFFEPSARFVDHTLAISEFLVGLSESAAGRGWELLDWQSEPRCWREVSTLGGRVVLRPDLFVEFLAGDYELRWFVEIDRATEHAPALQTKCRLYQTYYRSGREQRRFGVFPRVMWITPHDARANQIERLINSDRRLTPELFVVTTTERALSLIGETP